MNRTLTNRDVKEGFWRHRPAEGFPPDPIQDPIDYDGHPAVNVACTQTGLPPRQQARLVEQWCEALPSFEGVQFLWFSSHVPQALFDATCSIRALEGLWIKWSSIRDISRIAGLTRLRFLRIGSSPRLTSIEPLRHVDHLVWLELENVKQIADLTTIGEMPQLRGLEISGNMWSAQVVDSLAPLGRLPNLRYLSIPNLKAKDKTLRPLFELSTLEHFHAAQWWKDAELAQLKRANPKL